MSVERPVPADPVESARGLRARIRASYPTLSDTHRRVADFVLESAAEVSVTSSAALADALGVSNSTIVRFAQELGYEGYLALKRDLLHDLKQDLEPIERFKLARHRGAEDTIERVARQDTDNINATLARLTPEALSQLARRIRSARRVSLIGNGVSQVFAELLCYLLQQVRIDAITARADATPFEEKILRMSARDLVIGISFPTYSRSTVELMQLAKDQGAQIVAVTDKETSPVVALADQVLLIATANVMFTNSMTAFSVAANALVSELALQQRRRFNDEIAEQRTRLADTFLV